MSQITIVRTPNEIQRAHDQLTAIITGEIRLTLRADEMSALRANCDVLCWLLGHNHNPTFWANLAAIDGEFKLRGIREVVAPEPMTRDQWNRRN